MNPSPASQSEPHPSGVRLALLSAAALWQTVVPHPRARGVSSPGRVAGVGHCPEGAAGHAASERDEWRLTWKHPTRCSRRSLSGSPPCPLMAGVRPRHVAWLLWTPPTVPGDSPRQRRLKTEQVSITAQFPRVVTPPDRGDDHRATSLASSVGLTGEQVREQPLELGPYSALERVLDVIHSPSFVAYPWARRTTREGPHRPVGPFCAGVMRYEGASILGGCAGRARRGRPWRTRGMSREFGRVRGRVPGAGARRGRGRL